jgi:hypothetical protein
MLGPSDVGVRKFLGRKFLAEMKSFEDKNYIPWNTFCKLVVAQQSRIL